MLRYWGEWWLFVVPRHGHAHPKTDIRRRTLYCTMWRYRVTALVVVTRMRGDSSRRSSSWLRSALNAGGTRRNTLRRRRWVSLVHSRPLIGIGIWRRSITAMVPLFSSLWRSLSWRRMKTLTWRRRRWILRILTFIPPSTVSRRRLRLLLRWLRCLELLRWCSHRGDDWRWSGRLWRL